MSEACRVDGVRVARSGPPPGTALAGYQGGEHIHDAENGHDLMLEGGWEPLLERILDRANRRAAKP